MARRTKRRKCRCPRDRRKCNCGCKLGRKQNKRCRCRVCRCCVKRKTRRRRQRGGNKSCSSCQNPFVGKPTSGLGGGNYHPQSPPTELPRPQLTQQPMKGGGIWQDLGLTLPKEMYYDGMSYLKNVKNTWVGDNHESTSNVLKQPIAKTKTPTTYPVDYFKEFSEADTQIAPNLVFPTTT